MLQLTFDCVGPHRRAPPPVIGLYAPPQTPVKSGLPSARRGVATAAADGGGGFAGVIVQFGGVSVGLIAALMLPGAGTTTYICPVSVSVVVMSRTTVPFFFSTILPAYIASAGFSGLFQSL